MIKLETFNPVGRILTHLAKIAHDMGLDSFSLDIFDMHFAKYKASKDPANIVVNLPAGACARFMSADNLVGEATFFDEENISRRKMKVMVYHDLYTNSSLEIKDNVIVESKYAYHYKFTESGDDRAKFSMARPLFLYIMTSLSVDTVVFHGPAAVGTFQDIGKVCVDQTDFNVMVPCLRDVVEEDVQKVNVTSARPFQLNYADYAIKIRYKDKLTLLSFTQLSLTLFGVVVPPDLLLILSKIAIYCEMERIKGHVVTLEMETNTLSLDADSYTFYNKYVAGHSEVQKVTSFLGVYQDHLVAFHNGRIGFISGNRSAACFALSLSYLLAASFDGSFTSFFLFFKVLLENKVLSINNNSVIEGFTRLFMEKPAEFTIEGLSGTRGYKIKRIDSLKPDKDGLAIMGLGKVGHINLVPGEPDHYVVVEIRNGVVTLLYDPLKKVTEENYIMNGQFDSETKLIYFDEVKNG